MTNRRCPIPLPAAGNLQATETLGLYSRRRSHTFVVTSERVWHEIMTTARPQPALFVFNSAGGGVFKFVRLLVLLVISGTIEARASAEQPPTVSAAPASSITTTSAVVAGTINPNGLFTTYNVQWGTTTAYGSMSYPPLSAWGGNTPIAFTAGLSPLTPDTTYHYQFVATNSAGVAGTADLAFTTLGMFSSEGRVFTYARDNGAIRITAYSGPGGTVPIPNAIAGLPVAAIANSVFANLTSLTGVSLPDTLTSLGDSAFSGCSGLTSITLPNSLTNLGVATFSGCASLQSAILPACLIFIGDYAFSSCASLTAVTIPDSVTSIGSDAFSAATKLTEVTIPDSVTNLGAEAFLGCTSLASLTIGKGITTIQGGGGEAGIGTFANILRTHQ